MVVNGGVFHSLVIPYNSDVDMTDKMAGKAVLICRTNSHPFVDRTLSLEHPVKIGRSVARARAAQTNGVFDCKVLSRNHALIWYNNGKFYLQDTKSSNGTFVNNQRLSKSGEESLPREVSSGDIVQFGVDVLENARKVTHGCIVADLKLYLPDGKESKASPSTGILSGSGNVFIEDLYQLNQYIQEALQREHMLQTKLDSLQKLTVSLRRAADLGWKALIAEDRLLSRVEILENQLQTYSKSMGEDKLRGELRLLQEDKGVYQGLAKDCLQKVLQEKVEALQKCQTLEEALRCSKAECANYNVVLLKDQEEVIELAHKHSVHVARIVELQNQLQEAEEHHKEAIARLESNNEDLKNEVKRLLLNEVVMQDKIKRLEASGEIVGRQLLGIHDHLTTKNQRKGSTDDVICKNNEEMNEENEKVDSDPMITILERLSDTVEDQKINNDVYEMIKAQVDKKSKMDRITALEAELGLHTETMVKYKEENASLQHTLRTVEQTLRDQCLNRSVNSIIESLKTEKMSNGTQAIQNLESQQAQIEELKEAIKESHSKIAELEQTVISTQIDLNNAKKALTETMKGSVAQDEKLEEAQPTIEEPDSSVIMLKDQIDTSSDITLKNVTSHYKFQTESEYVEEVTNLKKQLEESQQTVNKLTNDAERLRDDLREAISELESLRRIADIRMQDNRTVDELTQSRMEAAALKKQIDGLLLQLRARPLGAKPSDRAESFGDDMGTSVDSETMTLKLITKKLHSKIIELDENLILVKQKFVECNNAKTALQHELSELKLDYDAVVHQPFFNLIFVLPLCVLLLAVMLALHPGLAFLLGMSAADPSLPDS